MAEDIVAGASSSAYKKKIDCIRNALRNGAPRDASQWDGITQAEIDKAAA